MVKLSSGIELNPNELTSEDREAIVKALEEMESGVWKPKRGDGFYFLGDNMKPCLGYFGDMTDLDDLRLELGMAFPNKEAAEKHLTYLKALQVLRGDTKGYEYEVGDEYYNGWWDVDEERLDCDRWTAAVNEGLKFDTLEDIKASFKAHEKEWRIVLLGVE